LPQTTPATHSILVKSTGRKEKSAKGNRPECEKGRKMSDPLGNLNLRQCKYIEGRVRGKTKTQAALDAGYAKSVSRNAKDRIETADVREAFGRLIREGVPAEKLVHLLREGLDAMETRVFTFRGKVRDTLQVINFAERRAYIELVMEYGGYRRST
jgi:phage terminase small subunit